MDSQDDSHGHWDPFGPALFDDPQSRAVSRVGVVDIGSNSVRMVVFDGAARSPAYYFNEKIMCGLGEGMMQTGRLNPEGRKRALAAMRRFSLLARGMELSDMSVVATAPKSARATVPGTTGDQDARPQLPEKARPLVWCVCPFLKTRSSQ